MKHQQLLKLDRLYYPLSELPDLLSISQNELIEQAIQGNLEFIVRVPPNAKVWSVHPDTIDVGSPKYQYKKLTGQAKPVNANETFPVSMEGHEIAGLGLSRSDCFRLRTQGALCGEIFDYAVNARGNWVQEVFPCPRNAFHKEPNHNINGWKLACYPNNTPLVFAEGSGYPKPLEIDITPDSTWVTQRSLDSFLYSLSNGSIVDEFFIRNDDGALIGIKEEALEPISDRLQDVLDTVFRCWQSYAPNEPSETTQDRQDAVNMLLGDEDFTCLFDNDEVGSGLQSLLKKATTPLFALEDDDVSESLKKAYPGYVTPHLVALVIGWKIHWSGKHIDPFNPATHPLRNRVREFMQKHGFPGNEARNAATLIRPSTAGKGRPVRGTPPGRPLIRKHILTRM